MARYGARQLNSRYVTGNLARDERYVAREPRRRELSPPARRARVQAPPRHRERIRVSRLAVLAFAAAAAMAVVLLMHYASLAALSAQIVREQEALADLKSEHVRLMARYEKTFDLAAVKEAAEQAGMAKPSASQIYYIDLSAPDSVVLYDHAEDNPLRRAAAAVGSGAAALVEYFK